jgi:nickel-dependent lactate racemase
VSDRKASAPPLPYGDTWIEDYLPRQIVEDGRLVGLQTPEPVPGLPDVDASLVASLEVSSNPNLVPSLSDWIQKRYRGGDVTVIVDDYTRPCVHQRRLLPGLLRWFLHHEVGRERIGILIAQATHRDPKPEEYPHMFGSVWPEWRDRIRSHHDQEDLVRLGTTPDGTPVELNGRAARSEAIVSLCDLDYHYFAGVSGGPKHLVPGIAGRAITTADHLRMFGPHGFAANCDTGILDGNPVYEYKRRAVRILLDALTGRGTFVYAIVSVLNPKQEFVALQGGDVLELHRQLRSVLDRVYVARVPRLADVAIVAAKHLGINVYQAGKAISTAARAVRPGGTILCVAPCPDGFGNEEFRSLMGIAAKVLDERDGDAGIEEALRVVQTAVMKDFKIGKQKPVDLLVRYRHTGRGNLWLLCEGLSEQERSLLPFRYVEGNAENARARLRAWVEMREITSKTTYVVIDDPTYWIHVEAPITPNAGSEDPS